ncbi:MAG TPA: hypothetical protein VJ793_27260 [Anaerolineae bacterium]|nr:hypothetical protein [Anaerolineae bacterium]
MSAAGDGGLSQKNMPRTDFDWQIGEDTWKEAPARRSGDGAPDDSASAPIDVSTAEAAIGPSPPRRRWWLVLPAPFVVAGIIATAIFAVVISRRVQDTAQSIEKDVLAAHELVRHALAQSDAELFASLLSRGTPGWRAAYEQLFEQGILLDRTAWGLQAQAVDPKIVDVTLSPDLQEAEVVSEYAYSVAGGSGATETVRLRHTWVYRFDRQRWLLAAPEGEFWGSWATSEGHWLTLTYSQRDEEIGRRLAGDLDAKLNELCDLPGIDCPTNWRVHLRLAREPIILSSLVEPEPAFARQWNFNLQANIKNMTLPTPTLIGSPTDEPGYQALYHGYALRVARAALADRVSPPPVWAWQSQRLYQALLDNHLIRLGLRRWPAAGVDRDAGPAPIPLPEQDIETYCVEDFGRGGSLYRYDPKLNTWSRELFNLVFGMMMPLPDGSGVILQEQASIADEAPTRIVLWQRGTKRVLHENLPNSTPVYATGEIDPSGQYLVVYASRDPFGSATTYHLLDLNNCSPSGCELRELAGWPTWSPDGSQSLVVLPFTAPDTLIRGDRLGLPVTELGEGQSPFWLDDETYGYIRREPTTLITRTSEMIIASSADDVPRLLLDSASLAAMPPGDEWWHTDSYVTVNPEDTNLLLITTYAFDQSSRASSGQASGTVFNLLFDRRSNEIRRQWQSSFDRTISIVSFSPDGRWLLMDELDRARSMWSIHMYDVKRGDTKTFSFALPANSSYAFPTYGWSADGRWLAILSDGVLHLVAPDHDYQRSALPHSPGCIFAAWVNRR